MADQQRGASGGYGQGQGGYGGQSGYGQGAQGGTGVSDPAYNPISMLYHALQGAELDEQYAEDGERSGDREGAQFCREMQQEERRRADYAKRLLAQRLQRG